MTDFIWDLGTGISKSLSIAHQIHVHVACPVVASMPVAMPSDGLRGVQAGKGAAGGGAAVESMKRGKGRRDGEGLAGSLAKARRGPGRIESCQSSSTSVFRVSGQPMQLRPGLPHPASCLTRPPLFPTHPPQHRRTPDFTRSLSRLGRYATHPHQGGWSMAGGGARPLSLFPPSQLAPASVTRSQDSTSAA